MSADEVTGLEKLTPLPEGKAQKRTEALDDAEREHGAKEARGMVQGIKALFQGETSVANLPGEYTDEDGVQRMDRRTRATGGYKRATDPPDPAQVIQTGPIQFVPDPPGPWDGVPAAVQVLRPLGRYDQVTDDAWRLVKAFCEARAVDRDRQDPALYNRVDRGQEGDL